MALFCIGPQWHGTQHPSPGLSEDSHTSSGRWEVHVFVWKTIRMFRHAWRWKPASQTLWRSAVPFSLLPALPTWETAVPFLFLVTQFSPFPKRSVSQPLSCAWPLFPACWNAQALRGVMSHSFKVSQFRWSPCTTNSYNTFQEKFQDWCATEIRNPTTVKSNILCATDLSWTLAENGKQVLHLQLPQRQKEGEQRSMHCPGAVESDILL